MADISAMHTRPPLGVTTLLSESFSIFFGNFFKVFQLAFGPALIGLLLSGALLGFGVVAGTAVPDISGPGFAIAIVLTILIQIVVYALTTALLVQLAYDAKLNRQPRLAKYLGPAFASVVPLVVLSLVSGILFMIGFALLIVPGLWIYAVFCVLAPAIVIEGAGFGGLGRSARLTKEYRWPIIGLLVLFLLILIGINMITGFVIGILSIVVGSVALDLILNAIMSTFGAGLASILVALIYARLREIKEGVSVDQIAGVFD
ncbi:hypothetical protein [uncultured Roseibium sp.]|uniref:hypothetical protein n=1 Tax=uncultured Roseibium sp. TaxID=1936171 RepID=UPI00260BA7BE|nr:hypothetical protein [uncultured Roseibium sp.]